MDETEKIDENEVVTQVPEKRDYEEELLKLIKSDEPPERLKEDLGDYHENDIAAILPKYSRISMTSKSISKNFPTKKRQT